MNTRKFHLPGEAALLIVLLINPLAIDLMSKSVFGISTISSVPLILSTAFPVFSFGTWNYIFQTLLVITLMVPEAFVLSRLSVFFCCRHRYFLLCLYNRTNRCSGSEIYWKSCGILPSDPQKYGNVWKKMRHA